MITSLIEKNCCIRLHSGDGLLCLLCFMVQQVRGQLPRGQVERMAIVQYTKPGRTWLECLIDCQSTPGHDPECRHRCTTGKPTLDIVLKKNYIVSNVCSSPSRRFEKLYQAPEQLSHSRGDSSGRMLHPEPDAIKQYLLLVLRKSAPYEPRY